MKTHAQNRFVRRLNNRRARYGVKKLVGGVGLAGDPIPGELTPVEIAKKNRRRVSRRLKLENEARRLPLLIQDAHHELQMLELRRKNPSEDETMSKSALKKAAEATGIRIANWESRLAALRLRHAKFV